MGLLYLYTWIIFLEKLVQKLMPQLQDIVLSVDKKNQLDVTFCILYEFLL